NYLKNRTQDEYLRWKRDYWLNFLTEHNINLRPFEQILDAGCGPAGIFTVLDEQLVEAIDPLVQEFDAKLDHFTASDYPYVQFYSYAIEQLNFKDRYDTIFCLNAINHVNNLKLCLNNLFAALKNGGRIFITVDAHKSNFLKKLFQTLPGDILHPQQFSINDYNNFFQQAGFTDIYSKSIKHDRIFNYHFFELHKK
ncbi:MAG: class I SAM-dependent methyltransferase, partial [Saprospiraceae bacterium]|nr:class I SAM-dependent methyltransferase [Saprospiraceae bacterium]